MQAASKAIIRKTHNVDNVPVGYQPHVLRLIRLRERHERRQKIEQNEYNLEAERIAEKIHSNGKRLNTFLIKDLAPGPRSACVRYAKVHGIMPRSVYQAVNWAKKGDVPGWCHNHAEFVQSFRQCIMEKLDHFCLVPTALDRVLGYPLGTSLKALRGVNIHVEGGVLGWLQKVFYALDLAVVSRSHKRVPPIIKEPHVLDLALARFARLVKQDQEHWTPEGTFVLDPSGQAQEPQDSPVCFLPRFESGQLERLKDAGLGPPLPASGGMAPPSGVRAQPGPRPPA